jgi:hypothetical protein
MTNVVKFPRPTEPDGQGWQSTEMQQVMQTCAASIAAGEASGWEVGATELGDPQVYLVGPSPDYDCILCISRIGRRYLIEDGNGNVVFEHDNPMLLAEQATAALRRRKAAIVARIAVAWCALREAIEEKTEALMAEPLELLSHVAPQLAALA